MDMPESTEIAPINESILPEYTEYSRLDEEIKRLVARRDAAKEKIRKWQEATGKKNAEGFGFSSVVVDGYSRETLIKAEIEKRFGTLPPECIKTTSVKPSFKIAGKLLVEG